MKPPRYSHPERESIDLTAADWLVVKDRGFTPAEAAEFGRWINESPLHAEAWTEAQAAWELLNRVSELPEGIAMRGAEWEVVNAEAGKPAKEARRLAWNQVLPWAAAAGLVVAIGVVGLWKQGGEAVITPPVDASRVAQIETVAPRTLFLPDGSRVELNGDSAIEENFTAAERHVRLVRGEVHFTVKKDATRPFVVDASGVTVRAVGTAFNVKLDPHAVEVLVTEGTVRLEEERAGAVIPGRTEALAEEQSFLDAGWRAIIPLAPTTSHPPEIASIDSDEIGRALAWQAVRLKFADLSLDRVAAEFNRLNSTQIIVDPSASDTLVAGTFRADNVAVFVDFMESAFGLTADRSQNGKVLLSKAR
ncbi:FecR family protein [Oleiharenicola lentus]|uniref:FecR family protein n=1 Tax=Oleiharenicola lentus TaxID=2508720 RepID=UPI003F675A15